METDICERKHGGAETSQEAFEKVQPQIKIIHQEIIGLMEHLTNGLTSKEYAGIVGKGLNQISGRFSELSKMGMIVKTDIRREGCAAWKVAK